MREEFEEMLDQLEAGKFVYVEPSSVMLELNEFMASRGYSVARLEVVRIRGGSRTGRTFEYDFLANRSPGYEKEWQIFLDPQRSAANIRDIVGGRSGSYEDVLARARMQALEEMKQFAAGMGGNAVVGVDLDYEVLGANGSMLMVSCSGTAVSV